MSPDPIGEFRAAMLSAGLRPPDNIIPGKLHRFQGIGKRNGNDAGRCKLFEDLQGGWFQDLSSDLKETWQAERPTPYSPEEREAFRRKCEADRKRRDAETRGRHERAAAKAAEIMAAASGDPASHPYAVKKAVPFGPLVKRGPWPQRGWADALLIPVYGQDGKVWTVEAIGPDGGKDYLKGGRKRGGFHPMGTIRGAVRVLIAEGLATVAAVHAVTSWPAVAALDAGNLELVGRAVLELAPDAELVWLADNDIRDGGRNHGLEAATAAASAVGGVVVAPDLDGRKCDWWDVWSERGPDAVCDAISQALPENGVTEVTEVTASNGAGFSGNPDENPEVTGVTSPVPSEIERPTFRVLDAWTEHRGAKYQPGVWFFGIKDGAKADAPPTLTQQWVCSPVHVEAVTFDAQDNNFGRLLRFKNTLGRWREWAMPMELLRGSGDELRGELLAMGVEIDPASKTLLANYLQAKPPKRRMRCALQVGWCGRSFVLPDAVIGPDAAGVIFQSGERNHDEYTQAGTLDGWRSGIAACAAGNPLLVLALSAAFAGPLLAKCNTEGGGAHYVGDSSTGKTTLLEAACSIWGGANYRRSWRATANGMEGAAALFNDGLLVLDEVSECDAREVGAIVYALGNGRGKQRASRSGNARGVTRWRCFVLSSGERTIETTMQEGGHRAKAGQSVRLLDIPASRAFGCFDDLHGFPSGAALSDSIKRAAATHHGHAGRAFLERLTRDERDFCALLERIKALAEFSAGGCEGQDRRAAARFALLALAGELATEYGVTGWPEGTAIAAAAEGVKAWRTLRGRGNDERRQVLERVSGFLDRHGDGRFSDADDRDTPIVRDRAGWWRDGAGGRVYLFNADGMREALKGFDFGRALDILEEAGAIQPPDGAGKRQKSVKIAGRVVKLYAVDPGKLGGEHGA